MPALSICLMNSRLLWSRPERNRRCRHDSDHSPPIGVSSRNGRGLLLIGCGSNLMLSMVLYNWYYHAVDASRADEPTRPAISGRAALRWRRRLFDLHGEGRLLITGYCRRASKSRVIAMLTQAPTLWRR